MLKQERVHVVIPKQESDPGTEYYHMLWAVRAHNQVGSILASVKPEFICHTERWRIAIYHSIENIPVPLESNGAMLNDPSGDSWHCG